MATIADKLSAIIGQKSDMVKNLNIKGVSSASDSEKFNTLVAKVLTVGGKNQYVKPGTGNTSSPTLNQKLGALYSQKNLLATYLTSMGVPASTSEKLNTLVPKILEIPMDDLLRLLSRSEAYASFSDVVCTISLQFRDLYWATVKELFTKWMETTGDKYNNRGLLVDDSNGFIKSIGPGAFDGIITVSSHTFSPGSYIAEISFPKCVNIKYEGCAGLPISRITFSDDIETIESRAFIDCDYLNYIGRYTPATLRKLTSIGESAFRNCSMLTTYLLTTNIQFIGSGAFWGCYRLQGIALNNVTNVFPSTFRNTSSLSRFGDITHPYYISLLKCNKIYEEAFIHYKSQLYSSYFDTTIYTGIRSIYAPECSYISKSAFYMCFSLSTVILPKVEYVGEGAFRCDRVFEASKKHSNETVYHWYSNVEPLSIINIPMCKSIMSEAFRGCEILSDFNLSAANFIGDQAFQAPGTAREVWYVDPSLHYVDSAIKYTNVSNDITITLSPSCSIGAYAFYGQPITDISYVNFTSAYNIQLSKYVFCARSGLKKFSYFSYITSMGAGALKMHSEFSDDIRLERVSVGESDSLLVDGYTMKFNLFFYNSTACQHAMFRRFVRYYTISPNKCIYIKNSIYDYYISGLESELGMSSQYLAKKSQIKPF